VKSFEVHLCVAFNLYKKCVIEYGVDKKAEMYVTFSGSFFSVNYSSQVDTFCDDLKLSANV